MNDQEYSYLKRKLRPLLGIDLDDYKSQQMRRRLEGFVSSNSESVALFCKTVVAN